VLAYEGIGRELVSRLKYRNARAAIPRLGRAMAARVDPTRVDVVTWAPTTPVRRRERGFDQAELLARAVARNLGRRCAPLLRRPKGLPQTGRSRADRRHGPAFVAVGPVPEGVLLVDDVVTTGATLSAAAKALREAGARRVLAVPAARTP
jgi:predicted amidophosphoribosyltransferase